MEQCHRSSSRRNAVRRAHLFTICERESERVAVLSDNDDDGGDAD